MAISISSNSCVCIVGEFLADLVSVFLQVVGYGMNGEENYIDDVHAPFPAIRYIEISYLEPSEYKEISELDSFDAPVVAR